MRKNIITALILLVIFFGYVLIQESRRPNVPQAVNTNNQTSVLLGRIGEGYFNFEIADSISERTQGLSGREPLAATDALLFVFDEADKHCFWMKEMKFNIDILWFDAQKTLVSEKRNATPESYPQNFCPNVAAKYVVEVTAGVAEKNQITIGQYLEVEL